MIREIYSGFGRALLVVPILIAIIAIVWVLRIGGLRVFGVAEQNANTAITRHSNQYITTQQTRLVQLMAEYERANAEPAQRSAILVQMRTVTATLEDQQVPPEIRAFMASHGGSQ